MDVRVCAATSIALYWSAGYDDWDLPKPNTVRSIHAMYVMQLKHSFGS
jgi:hypothetical protein